MCHFYWQTRQYCYRNGASACTDFCCRAGGISSTKIVFSHLYYRSKSPKVGVFYIIFFSSELGAVATDLKNPQKKYTIINMMLEAKYILIPLKYKRHGQKNERNKSTMTVRPASKNKVDELLRILAEYKQNNILPSGAKYIKKEVTT